MEHEATFTAITNMKQETFYHEKNVIINDVLTILYNFPRVLIVKRGEMETK